MKTYILAHFPHYIGTLRHVLQVQQHLAMQQISVLINYLYYVSTITISIST